jgi:hypothetical protein
VEIQFCTFKNQKEWLLAKNIWDSKVPPTQYGANLVEEKPLTCTKFMALMQSGFTGGGQNKPCFECRSTDHWKKECPKLKNQQGHGQQKGQDRFHTQVGNTSMGCDISDDGWTAKEPLCNKTHSICCNKNMSNYQL